MKPVLVKKFYLDHVFAQNKILFNTNNHHFEEKIPAPKDYNEVLDKGNTCNWIDKFHDNNYYKLILDSEDLKWMSNALFKIGIITRRFSELYQDELIETAKKYAYFFENLPKNDKGWFVRSDSVSLKEGIHGVGPYKNITQVIESIVTTSPNHCCFTENDTSCSLYFLPFIDIDSEKEFRIFVHNNQITALSDQHLYTINEHWNTKNDNDISIVVYKIIEYFENNIKDKMKYMENYVMDLALIGEEETPYFIEPNSFGKYYAAGSALFHWIYDHDALYGESDSIEFRYVSEY